MYKQNEWVPHVKICVHKQTTRASLFIIHNNNVKPFTVDTCWVLEQSSTFIDRCKQIHFSFIEPVGHQSDMVCVFKPFNDFNRTERPINDTNLHEMHTHYTPKSDIHFFRYLLSIRLMNERVLIFCISLDSLSQNASTDMDDSQQKKIVAIRRFFVQSWHVV